MLRLKVLPFEDDAGPVTFYWLITRDTESIFGGPGLPQEVEESKSRYLNRLRCEHAGEKRLLELQKNEH